MQETRETFDYRVGATMPNGSTLLDFYRQRDGLYIVLCKWNKAGSPSSKFATPGDEYITWFADDRGETVVGVYGTLSEVAAYYEKRIRGEV